MTISYRYKTIKRADGVTRKLPYIPIHLKGNNLSWIQFMALVDSGADISVIPKDIAELLDLDLSGPEEIANGIGGEVKVKNSSVQIEVKNPHEEYSFKVPVQVIMEKTKAPVILGRAGFFDNFIIEFDNLSEKIRLKKIIRNK